MRKFLVVFFLLSLSAFAADEAGTNGTNVNILNYDTWCYSPITISGAPVNAMVTSIDVHFAIVHPYSGDLHVDLNDEGLSKNHVLWDQEGGDQPNPARTATGITIFNGLPVNGTWKLYATDMHADSDNGYIDSWWIKVYYDEGYSIVGRVTNVQYNGDADSDGYNYSYSFTLETEASGPSDVLVYSVISCPGTGKTWQTNNYYLPETSSVSLTHNDFNLSGNTDLVFNCELFRYSDNVSLAVDNSFSGEPVKVDPHSRTPTPESHNNNDDDDSKPADTKKFCFIATAAYGSYLDPHVKVLRDFRDEHLLTNSFGRSFVRLYYEFSPPLADYISQHKTLKTVTRLALTPIFYGIKYPKICLLIILLAGISIIFAGLNLTPTRNNREKH